MKKKAIYISIVIMTLVATSGVFAPKIVNAQFDLIGPVISTASTLLSSSDTNKSVISTASSLVGVLNPLNWVTGATKVIGTIILAMMGILVFLAGTFLDFVISLTIVGLKEAIDHITVIETVWRILRDFVNMFFIFIVLYVAVSTILGREGVNWKKTLSSLVLVAIFMNFSLFMTKVVVDVSNIVTLGFYDQLPDVSSAHKGLLQGGRLSLAIMQSLNLQSFYDPKSLQDQSSGFGSITQATGIGGVTNDYVYIMLTIMGSTFLLITAFIMAAAGILFLIRFVKIILLMIFSPLAFVGSILPGTKLAQLSGKWWSSLTSQALFPPVYMALVWISFTLLQSKGFHDLVPNVKAGFIGSLLGGAQGVMLAIFNFCVVIFLMTYALVAAKEVGADGVDMVSKFGATARKSIQGFVGRNTIGRAGKAFDDKIKGNDLANKNLYKYTGFDGSARDALKAVTTKATFGSETSFADREKKIGDIGRKEKFGTDLKAAMSMAAGPARDAEISRVLRGISTQELVANLKPSDLNNQTVADRLTDAHYEAIEKDTTGKWSEADKVAAKEARIRPLTQALVPLAPGATPAQVTAHGNQIRSVVSGMSDKQKGRLDETMILNREFITNIDSGSFAAIMKNAEIPGATKQEARRIRYQALDAAANNNIAEAELRRFNAEEISKINSGTLLREVVMDRIDPAVLAKLADVMNQVDKNRMRQYIETDSLNNGVNTPQLIRSRIWLNGPTGSTVF